LLKRVALASVIVVVAPGAIRRALFAAPADNILLLKISYWLGM
jgi:hypothetical protein